MKKSLIFLFILSFTTPFLSAQQQEIKIDVLFQNLFGDLEDVEDVCEKFDMLSREEKGFLKKEFNVEAMSDEDFIHFLEDISPFFYTFLDKWKNKKLLVISKKNV
jgi:hypothetical protein